MPDATRGSTASSADNWKLYRGRRRRPRATIPKREDRYVFNLLQAWKDFAAKHDFPILSLARSEEGVIKALEDFTYASPIYQFFQKSYPDRARVLFDEWKIAVLVAEGSHRRDLTEEERRRLDEFLKEFTRRDLDHTKRWQERGMF